MHFSPIKKPVQSAKAVGKEGSGLQVKFRIQRRKMGYMAKQIYLQVFSEHREVILFQVLDRLDTF
jgi:hypothetical protein